MRTEKFIVSVAASRLRGRVRRGRVPRRVSTVLLALKRPAFKVARKREERMYEIYTTRPHLEILIVEGLCPRAVDSARSQRRKTRYDLVPAGGSPHRARFSLVITKLPL